jgi:hypothetical protein
LDVTVTVAFPLGAFDGIDTVSVKEVSPHGWDPGDNPFEHEPL